jgi:hypothetical protein
VTSKWFIKHKLIYEDSHEWYVRIWKKGVWATSTYYDRIQLKRWGTTRKSFTTDSSLRFELGMARINSGTLSLCEPEKSKLLRIMLHMLVYAGILYVTCFY